MQTIVLFAFLTGCLGNLDLDSDPIFRPHLDETGDLEYQDPDEDGFTEEDGDCNEDDPDTNPEGIEDPSNGIDDNCNGRIDADYQFSIDWSYEEDARYGMVTWGTMPEGSPMVVAINFVDGMGGGMASRDPRFRSSAPDTGDFSYAFLIVDSPYTDECFVWGHDVEDMITHFSGIVCFPAPESWDSTGTH